MLVENDFFGKKKKEVLFTRKKRGWLNKIIFLVEKKNHLKTISGTKKKMLSKLIFGNKKF